MESLCYSANKGSDDADDVSTSVTELRSDWMRKMLHADQRLKQNHKEENLPGLHQEQFAIGKRTWTDVEPGKYLFSDCEVSKKLIRLLRHGNQVHRGDDGAIEFWRIKDNLQKHFPYCLHWSDEKWKSGHSGRNFIDPSLQDNVIIQSNFFQCIYHVGCAINLHSIISSGLIPGGQSLSNRQTDSILSACGS